MTMLDNKARDRQFLEQVLNQGKVDLILDFYASESAEHMLEDAPMLRRAFPDLHFTIEEQLAEGDKVMTRWTARGTHLGELGSSQHPEAPKIPPTGNQATWVGVTISRWADGKIVEQWIQRDLMSLMQQLGVVRGPGQTNR